MRNPDIIKREFFTWLKKEQGFSEEFASDIYEQIHYSDDEFVSWFVDIGLKGATKEFANEIYEKFSSFLL